MQLVNKPVLNAIRKQPSHNSYTLYKVVVECTSGSLPAVFAADLGLVINHHNAGGVDIAFTCQDTIHKLQYRRPRGNCLVAIATSPKVHTLCWFPSHQVLDGSLDELLVHTACLDPAISTGHQRAAPSVANGDSE